MIALNADFGSVRMQKEWGGVPTQFINDIDPYEGLRAMPAPIAIEKNSDADWQDFQDTETKMDAEYAEYAATQLSVLWP